MAAIKGGAFIVVIVAVILLSKSSYAIEKLCPFGTFGNDEGCYEPHMQRTATFESSVAVCSENGGKLVVVDDYIKQTFLNRLALKAKYDKFWIQNGDATSEDCFSIEHENDFEVKLDHCDQNYFHICEYDECPGRGFHCQQSGNKFFEISRSRSKYSKAEKSCAKKGGELATIYNEDKQTFIEEIILKNQWWTMIPQSTIDKLNLSGTPTYWAGAKYEREGQIWQSAGGIHASLFFNYLFKDSDNLNDSCVISDFDKYVISDCESYNYFFCQYPHPQAEIVEISGKLGITGVLYNTPMPYGFVLLTIIIISVAIMVFAKYRQQKSLTSKNAERSTIFRTSSLAPLLASDKMPNSTC